MDRRTAFRLKTSAEISNRQLIGRMLLLAWRHRRHCLAVLSLHALMVVASLSGLGFAGLGIDVVRHAADRASQPPSWPLDWSPPADWSTMRALSLVAGLIVAIAIINAFVRYHSAIAAARLVQAIVVQLRCDVYDKLQRLSFRFFDANSSGSIIHRVAGDVQAVRTFVDGVLLKVLAIILSLSVYLVYMSSVHAVLTAACLATVPMLWIGSVLFSRLVRPDYVRNSELVDEMILVLTENVQGAHVVKGFGREGEESAKFAKTTRLINERKSRVFWKVSLFQPLMGMACQLNMVILLAYGGYLVIRGEIRLGEGLFVFANLLNEFANQVGQITNVANTAQSSLTGAQRVFEILDAPVEIRNAHNALRLGRAHGTVELENVSFEFEPGVPVLTNVSFRVEAGMTVGLVGPTGAGKTTLLALITRFYDPTAGRVLIDGVDARDIEIADLRRNVGVVFQECFLFSNTASANIAFGDPDADDGRIERAAQLAAAHEFLTALPDGYATVIGEYGANLSGGQRQRLAIARALLLDPAVLILDDAMASVDPETEHEIGAAVERAMRGRTTFIVGQRVSSLQRADLIVVLDGGQIVQMGTHSELLAQAGHYRDLAALQFCNEPTETSSEPVLEEVA